MNPTNTCAFHLPKSLSISMTKSTFTPHKQKSITTFPQSLSLDKDNPSSHSLVLTLQNQTTQNPVSYNCFCFFKNKPVLSLTPFLL